MAGGAVSSVVLRVHSETATGTNFAGRLHLNAHSFLSKRWGHPHLWRVMMNFMGIFLGGSERRFHIVWRLLVYLVCFIVVLWIDQFVLGSLTRLRVPHELSFTLAVGIAIFAVLGLTWFMRRKVDKRSWRGMALQPLKQAPVRFMTGALLALGFMAASFAVMWTGGMLEIRPFKELHAMVLVIGLFHGLLLNFLIGFREELMARGYIFQNLAESMPIWSATLISGLLFVLIHAGAAGFNLAFFLGVVVLSFLLVALRIMTGSLWTAIGFHFAWDLAQDILSLLHVRPDGPVWLVGSDAAASGGVLWVGLEVITLLSLLEWARRHGRSIQWGSRLLPDGRLAR